MTNSDKPSNHLGRPPDKASRQVCHALLSAAEECLKEKRYKEITVREIAALADVNPAMINYYFSSKQNLFIALVDFLFSEWDQTISNIIADMPNRDSLPTMDFIRAVKACFYQHAPIIRLLTAELSEKGSGIQTAYHDRLASRTVKAIMLFLDSANEHGFYHRRYDKRYMAQSLGTMCIHPVSLSPTILSLAYSIETEELLTDSWANYLAENVNRLLIDGRSASTDS